MTVNPRAFVKHAPRIGFVVKHVVDRVSRTLRTDIYARLMYVSIVTRTTRLLTIFECFGWFSLYCAYLFSPNAGTYLFTTLLSSGRYSLYHFRKSIRHAKCPCRFLFLRSIFVYIPRLQNHTYDYPPTTNSIRSMYLCSSRPTHMLEARCIEQPFPKLALKIWGDTTRDGVVVCHRE